MKELIKELMDEGFSKETAFKMARKELEEKHSHDGEELYQHNHTDNSMMKKCALGSNGFS